MAEKKTAEITTSSGFTCSLDLNRIASMDFLDALQEYQDGNSIALSRVVSIMFDKETKSRLYEHVRNEEGLVLIDDTAKEILEILNGCKKGKNS